MSTLDWGALTAAADDAGFKPLPPSEYDVIVDTAEVAKTSGNNGGGPKDVIKVKFKVENGPCAGQAAFNNFTISPENPNALGFFFRHMAALGLDRGYFDGNPPLTQVARDLVGRRCRIKTSLRPWEGEDRTNIDKILPPVGGAGAVPTVATPGVPAAPVPGYVPTPGAVPATSTGVPPVPSVPTVPAVAAPVPAAVPPTPVVAPPAPMAAPAPMAPPPPLGDVVPGASGDDDLPF